MENLKIDFRSLDLLSLKAIGILPQDLGDLFIAENSRFHRFKESLYVIGYINQIKFIYTVFKVSESVNFDVELLRSGIPNEEDIKRYWCRGRREG